jgi:hypothetical protein
MTFCGTSGASVEVISGIEKSWLEKGFGEEWLAD